MKARGRWMLFPLWAWTLLFVMLPMGYVLLLSFVSGDAFGIRYAFTLANYQKLFSKDITLNILKTLRMSGMTTLLTLLAGYPFAYFMAKAKRKWRNALLALVIIPFWTSALMRMFGWRILLQNNGVLNAALEFLYNAACRVLAFFGAYKNGAMPEYARIKFLYTRGVVLFGMAYTMLPFMILSIYSSVEKLDASTREAARDLGAGPRMAFLTVTLPLSMPGVISGCVLTFVPSMGLFFINKILGGGTENYLGDLIDFYLKDGRDWALGAALSMVVLALTFLSMAVYRRFSDGGEMGVF